MTGACTCLTISGTAFAAASLLTVTRTNSLPAAWSALTCATVPGMSAVSVLVMDWTTMGRSLPTLTPPTSTNTVFLRFEKLISASLYHGDRGLPERRGIVDNRSPDLTHPIEENSMLVVQTPQDLKVEKRKRGINYGSNKVRFTNMVPAGSRVRLKQTIKNVEDVEGNGVRITSEMVMEVEGQERPALVAEVLGIQYA